ncbi:SpoIIE family protein phosphatase, partial [Mycobacterium sp.]|uniref:SpoIIE family protein phosphatase n=1 Tax=Mycobacterium sp. TaxID=1785 RepID=UPI0025EE07FC
MPTELTSGDRGIAVDLDGDGALFGVVDGLGHGPEAATAALRAVDVVKGAPDKRLEVLVQLCHRLLDGTRGVAMTLARIDFGANTLTWTGVGNVAAELVAKAPTGFQIRSSARLTAGIIGYRIPEVVPAQVHSIRPGDMLVISTDGIDPDHLDHIDFAASAVTIADELLA